MPKIIKQGAIVDDNFVVLAKDATEIPASPVIVSLQTWQANKDTLAERSDIGVWLDSDEPADLIAEDADKLSLIAINFPVFSDGRGYSYARELRDRYGYKGELRAIGDVLRDQLSPMIRCGFDSLAVRADLDIESCLDNLADFTQPYQAATVQSEALFNRFDRG